MAPVEESHCDEERGGVAGACLDNLLLPWFDRCHRDLPWRRTRDPYPIWVSEVMLQQTRVDAVIPYFERFLGRFPTLSHLAEAEEGEVLKAWEGLGYYARARNLRAAARILVQEGRDTHETFPRTLEDLMRLPGVGRYTAGAIGSMAFGLALPAFDGNVRRVLSRLQADGRPRAALECLARELVECTIDPSRHNQALMELGALVCTPGTPHCESCPLAELCAARATGRPGDWPASLRRAPVPVREMVAGVVRDGEGRLLIVRRPSRGLLGGLWDIPCVPWDGVACLEQTCRDHLLTSTGLHVLVDEHLAPVRHAYSHFKVVVHPLLCTARGAVSPPVMSDERRWIPRTDVVHHAFPRVTHRVFEAWALAQGTQEEQGSR